MPEPALLDELEKESIIDLFKDEANCLACWIGENEKTAPHRVLVSVRREIERLRELATKVASLENL